MWIHSVNNIADRRKYRMRNETIRLLFIFPKLKAMKSEPRRFQLCNVTEGPTEIDPIFKAGFLEHHY